MNFHIMTLFPAMVEAVCSESIIGRAREAGIISVREYDIRDHANNKHNKVDDTPYGGGMGMLMAAPPVCECFDEVVAGIPEDHRRLTVYMSPKGRILDHKTVKRLSGYDDLIILCGHYEGIDERAIEEIVDEQISIGDYVVTGGELPACILVDCVSRLIPGVLADSVCYEDESIASGLLEYPQYTRPYRYRGKTVPDVLLSGHHENVAKWRAEQALKTTEKYRPDLLEKHKNGD
ncbi:MAG: tRNA (guanosine(37)-N1)-methyltransferase TrmD [Clostridia bacterium]|nr:tRNA (guanosine(37)-N1)-methyltransferase TrmD [Clostridia bacterium]